MCGFVGVCMLMYLILAMCRLPHKSYPVLQTNSSLHLEWQPLMTAQHCDRGVRSTHPIYMVGFLFKFVVHPWSLCVFVDYATSIIDRICCESDRADSDTILYNLERTLSLVDNTLQLEQRDSRLITTRRRLVSLYEHWTVPQSHLPPCTVLAVEVGCRSVNHSVRTG